MKIITKIFFTIIILAAIVAALAYIDYFLVVKKDTLPKFALKEENKEKEVIVYKGLLYKLWYCTYDKSRTIGSYSDAEAICPRTYEYVDDYYTNNNGLKISKKDLQLMTYKNIYTYDMIELMSDTKEVSNASYVVYEYGKTFYEEKADSKVKYNKKNLKLVSFPDFVLDGKNYVWKISNDETTKYYCMDEKDDINIFSLYENEKCSDTFEKIKLDDKWCELAKNSTLAYMDNVISDLCSE